MCLSLDLRSSSMVFMPFYGLVKSGQVKSGQFLF